MKNTSIKYMIRLLPSTILKMKNGENVSIEIIYKIFIGFKVEISNIVSLDK